MLGEYMLKITIITICHNVKNEIRATIESVCNQSYPNTEYFIIDGASTDGTLEVIQEYSRFENLKIYSEKDFGIYNAMNRGIARASGDYIFFLNAGDVFYNEYVLEEVSQYMLEDADIIYYGKVCLVLADGSKIIEDFSEKEGSLEEKLLNGLMPCHQSIFAPRKLLTDHYFRESYKIRADYEWLIYSVSKGNKCIGIPVTISYYDMSGMSGKYRNQKLSLREEEYIIQEYEKSFKQPVGLSEQKKEVMRWKHLAQKHFSMFQLMDQWMGLKQEERCVGSFLRKRGYNHIAIYGMGYIGRRLYDDLQGSIGVDYVIDQKKDAVFMDINICSPNDKLKAVDAVIVTAIMDFNEIKNELSQKMECSILAFEDIINEMTIQKKNVRK